MFGSDSDMDIDQMVINKYKHRQLVEDSSEEDDDDEDSSDAEEDGPEDESSDELEFE